MSDVIIIDDDGDSGSRKRRAPQRQRQQQQQQQGYIELLDSSSEEEYEAPKPKKRAKKSSAKHHHDEDEDAWEAEKSAQKMQAKKPKQQRQPKEPKEKRCDEAGKTVRYSAHPSAAVYDRIQRALPGSGHRMFLISTEQVAPAGAPGGRAQEFVVLGATGNVYDVTISRHPHCSCPDHAKGNLCKHILFVLLRVLKLSTTNPLVWQRALLTKEVEEVLSGAHSQGVGHLNGVLADAGVRRAYAAATGQDAAAGDDDEAAAAAGQQQQQQRGARKPVEGDCPICFCELQDGNEPLVWCEGSSGCGNNMHKQCFDKWAAAKRGNGQQVTCVYCRAVWPGAAGTAADAHGIGGSPGYLNLAQHSSQHAHADTSLEALYGENATWINYHAGRAGYGGRTGAARMYASGNYGRRRA